MTFQLLIKSKMLKNQIFLAFKRSGVVFIMLINVKMPTTVGIFTFMRKINFMLKISFITSGPGCFNLIVFLSSVGVCVICIFLAVSWVVLRSVIMAFHGNTHLFK